MDRIKQLGRLAEDAFAKWATAAEVTKNVSKEDERGWDFIVEFELEEEESARDPRTLDHDLRGVKAFVQVKGTDGTPEYRDLKLSNARSLIADTMSPAFLCVLEFDGGMEPQRAYLVHLGRDFTARVLKRLRELPIEERDRLHKHEIRVRYSTEHQVEMSGAALRSALLDPVQGNPRDYERRKSKWLKEVGYGEVNARFKFQIEPPEEYEGDAVDYIADFATGLRQDLKIVGGKLWDVRFGIQQPSPEQIKKGKLETDPDTKNVILVFKARDDSAKVRMGAQLFQWSAIAEAIPRSRRKIRVSAPGLELVLYTSEEGIRKFGFSFQLERPGGLSSLRKTASLIHVLDRLGEEDKEVDVSLLMSDDFEGLKKGRIPLGGLECRGFLEGQEETSLAWSEFTSIATAVENAHKIAQFCDLPGHVETTLDQMHKRRLGYHIVTEMIQGKKKAMKLTFTDMPEQLSEGQHALIAPAATQIGRWIVIIAFGITGHFQYEYGENEDDPSAVALVGEEGEVLDMETFHVKEGIPYSASEYREKVQDSWQEELDDNVTLVDLEEESWINLRVPPGQ